MELYSLTKENLESHSDQVKVSVLDALVSDGLLQLDEAELWCERHTLILSKKSFFRTISDKWRKRDSVNGVGYLLVVSKK